ncbi:MAG: OpgC domain-containing protein [Candidatus Dojkabacteria bacterium]|nr:MAG: OpgC domain-containing protein [Candidatus Dojkabacteria bacterium]
MGKQRIQLIDVLRGHFLFAILFDHLGGILGPSLFYFYNWYGWLWVSAAEGFVFISGFMFGYIYIFKSHKSFLSTTQSILRRIGLLYIVSIVLTVIYSRLFWFNSLPLSGIFAPDWRPVIGEIVYRSLLLQHYYGWADILSLYIYCLVFAIPIIYLLRKKLYGPALIGSFLLWAGAFLEVLPEIKVSSFHVFSWQFLFVIGIACGAQFEKVKQIVSYISKSHLIQVILMICAILIIAGSLLFPDPVFFGIRVFEKGMLVFGRLALFPVWLSAMVVLAKLFMRFAPKSLVTLYTYLGERSLVVYTTQSFFITIVTVATDIYLPQNYWINTAIIAVATMFLVFSVTLFEKGIHYVKRSQVKI